jgi:hypothetical protein
MRDESAVAISGDGGRWSGARPTQQIQTSPAAATSPAIAGRACPTPRQFAQIVQCSTNVPFGDYDRARLCVLPWTFGEFFRCARDDPTLSNLTADDLTTMKNPPALATPPAPASADPLCDRLIAETARRTDVPDAVRGEAILDLLAACDGVAPPQPISPPAAQIPRSGITNASLRPE